MRYPHFLFVCWCSSIFAVTSCVTVDGYSCLTTYWQAVTCVLNITGNSLGPSNTTYRLKFTHVRKNTTCPLVWINHSYYCDCNITETSRLLNSNSKYKIDLCTESVCQSLIESFSPSINIQLTRPDEVKIQQTPEAFNITWKSGYENRRFLADYLDYEVLLLSFESSKSNTLKSPEKSVLIPRSHVKSYAKFCIKVRSFPRPYNGIWSKWSPPACWQNDEVQKENEKTSVILTKVLAPLCVGFAVLLFVYLSPTARMKIKTLSHTPSPAPFFQPLFQQYEGNLQDWLSPQSKCALIYKTEELLTTHAVTVVPKPMTKDPEENQDFYDPSVAQLAFAQCQTSYVGLPEMHKVSSPITMVFPGDTSYTQLPCSVWEFDPGEVQIMSSPPKDSFSCSDSGCSFESLTKSPDCSLPTSPVTDSSPPFYSSDYCILNKTAGGVVPVLVTKGNHPNIPSDPDQKDES